MAAEIRALVLRAPGINTDQETAFACTAAGFTTDLGHVNRLVERPGSLDRYQLLVIPGGFSYGDHLGAGRLLAADLALRLAEHLERFVQDGRLVLGICNGFQVLVHTGLLPGNGPEREIALAPNESGRFECRWVYMQPHGGPCVFTRGLEAPLQMSVAHGEGRFLARAPRTLAALRASGQVALTYCDASGRSARYPANPNGSEGAVAGLCNATGNVFGLMPHPERGISPLQHPNWRALGDSAPADGALLFANAASYARSTL